MDMQDFVRKAAENPGGVEDLAFRQMVSDMDQKLQQNLRKLMAQMVDLVPGQLFRDIERFHKKFDLSPTDDPCHRIPDDVLSFRIKFLFEELQEYCEAVGRPIVAADGEGHLATECRDRFDAEQAFDALIDLVYVTLGTAYLHRFNFNEGWARVQAANMAKVRAKSKEDSKRGSSHDVVKPPGWEPAKLGDLLDEVCKMCNGTGEDLGTMHADERPKCESCSGTGRSRRTNACSPAE